MNIKLLVVDDEDYIREGIVAVIEKKDLGIAEIRQADDGKNGFEKAREYCPDIILADVRMPRMDGINMAFKIKEILPDCCIIFMSGYSDKEYLKSAIKLSAITYIEKPIDLNELEEAIQEAIKSRESIAQKKETDRKLDTCIPVVKNEIAIKLCKDEFPDEEALEYMKIIEKDGKIDRQFQTILIQVYDKDNNNINSDEIFMKLENFLREKEYRFICGKKENGLIICHISFPENSFGILQYKETEASFTELINRCDYSLIIAEGEIVNGVENISKSYKRAIEELDKGFYKKIPYLIKFSNEKNKEYKFDQNIVKEYAKCVEECRPEETFDIIKQTVKNITIFDDTPVSKTKNFFADFSRVLVDIASKRRIEIFDQKNKSDIIYINIQQANFIYEIESFLVDKTDKYFEKLKVMRNKNLNVEKIIDFIDSNYNNPMLSLDYIAERLSLSTSYICVLFKKHKGLTLNQYITEYKIKKAKKMLKDIRPTVKTISEKLGYNDCNYFIKVFKKETGMTPIEYRENEML